MQLGDKETIIPTVDCTSKQHIAIFLNNINMYD